VTIGVAPLGLKFQILQNAPNEAIRCKRIASHPPHHWRISVLASVRPHFPLYICRATHSSYRLCAKTKSRVEISSLGMAFLFLYFFWFSERTLVGNFPITHVPDKQPVSLVKKSTNRSMYNQPNTQYIFFVFN